MSHQSLTGGIHCTRTTMRASEGIHPGFDNQDMQQKKYTIGPAPVAPKKRFDVLYFFLKIHWATRPSLVAMTLKSRQCKATIYATGYY